MIYYPEEMYMWSSTSIVYNVITKAAVWVNYTCLKDMQGNGTFESRFLSLFNKGTSPAMLK